MIFAPDPTAAAAEIARVLRPGGRLVLSAWLREGALFEQGGLRRDLMARVRGETTPVAPFAWHDHAAVTGLLAHEFVVSMNDHELAFRGTSPAAFAAAELANHPLWVEAREVVEPAGKWGPFKAELDRLFEAANEDPDGFQITSRYVVAVAMRSSA
jgi:SAM-dependent methyltransferase